MTMALPRARERVYPTEKAQVARGTRTYLRSRTNFAHASKAGGSAK
jgi:hypothetical protein